VELLEALQYAFYPTIYLWAFDECEHDHDMSYQGFEAGYPLVSHHVDLEFPNEGVGVSSVAVEDKWGNACGF